MAADRVVDIIVPSNAKSDVWGHFGHPVYDNNGRRDTDKKNVICKLCRVISPYNGNTTNMKTHLNRHHPGVCGRQIKCKPSANPSQCTDMPSLSEVKIKPSTTSTTAPNFTLPSCQISLDSAFKSKYPMDSSKAKTITKAIAVYIALDMRPLSVVENEGFKKLLNVLDSKYSVPSRKHFSETVIPELYDMAKHKVMTSLTEASSVAITTDSWTSRACQSYVTITVHFIDNFWNITSYVLQTRALDVSYTGVNVGNVLMEGLLEWGLKHTDIALVTDNAANMHIAAETAGFYIHLGCFAHTVNLACQKGLKVGAMSRLLARIRKIVNFFHRSTTASAVLKAKQSLLKLKQHKLLIDVTTRWNSSFDMVERFLEQQPAVISALAYAEVRKNVKDIVSLTEEDISQAENAMVVLKPLKTVTNVMCDEKNPTVSLIYPMKTRLMDNMAESPSDSKLVKEVKQAIRENLNNRYTDPNIREFLLIAAALDPRFKSLPMLTDEERAEIFILVEVKAASLSSSLVKVKTEDSDEPVVQQVQDAIARDGEQDVPTLPGLPTLTNDDETTTDTNINMTAHGPTPCNKSAMEDLMGDVNVVSYIPGNQKSVSNLIADEVISYKQEHSIPLNTSPLAWWSIKSEKYKYLSKLAKHVLGIPATSVPSERVFSTAGDIVTATRSCLKPEIVDMMVFLKNNLPKN